jgi:hypothetical protein
MPRNQRSAVLVRPLRNGPQKSSRSSGMRCADGIGEASEEFLRREQGRPELSEEALMELEVPEDEAQS